MIGMVAVPASAEGSSAGGASLAAVDSTVLTASARAILETSPVVAAAPDAVWGFDAPTLTAVTPPPPPPEPEPVVETRAASTSRSTARAAVVEEEAPAEEAAATQVPASAVGNAIVEIAARYIGVPYVSGGTTPDGFDCSGYTSYVFAQVGITLPRTSAEQRYAGTVVSRADAQPGDLIWSPGHISIYAGDGMQLDAPRPGKTIQLRSIWQSSPVFIRVG
ncbi:C40 family peptidase [Cellulomonas cellasea]|uniref:Cell wall-associated NlpC family hydrolase n=1 Tax=Cellulomonas cellasea TaxID=43670 RepID=A0A7W4UEN9_9CELL|nr:C40 family peptidase [Cellulomonas cellasea]MBB2922799.1 cell wall-associated NlpC family hydrolase [Cellulomonas cellasea]